MSGFPSPGNLRSAPEDWTRVRLKFAVDYINEKVDFEGDGEYVALENISSWTSIRLPSETPLEPSSQTNRFQSGDVLFGKLRPYLAKVLLVDFDGYASSECLVLRGKAVLPEFVRYWCLSKDFIELVDGSTFGSKMPRADWDFIGNTVALIPPPPVQRAIAAHLDRETAKIDTLIAKKRELIAKLKEQRSALISRTVTRGLPPEAAQAAGLDPNPPMKDSGVEWIGEVPAHWTVKPVKFLTQIVRGQFTHRPRNDPSLYDGAYPFVQTGDIARAKRYVTEYSQTLNDLGLAVSKQFPEGTLVMTIAANIGDMAVINFPACFPDSIVGFIPTARVDIDFLYYLFLAMKRELLATATLNTQLNLNVERIAAIDAVQPPVNEQRKIADYLDKACGEIDSLLLKVETAITRLTEYRAALITAAVTGQLEISSTG